MITRRYTVEIHQEMEANHPRQITDTQMLIILNKRLSPLITGSDPIDAISIYRDHTSPAPEIGQAVEQSWLPWNDPPHQIELTAKDPRTGRC